LATTSSYYTDAVPANSTLAAGTFSVAVGGAAATPITIDATNNTLAGLAAAINNKNAGVLASVISDANGSRLAIVSQTTGAAGDLTVSANSSGLNFNKAVTGSNAALTVDGVPISSPSNTVTGVINGVTLSLTAASPGNPVALTIAPDKTQTTNALNQFVSAYNTAIKDINKQFTVAADGSGGGALEADGSLREAQQALLSAVSYSVSGNNGAVNLSSIGLGLNNDGTLTVDSGKLGAALASNFSGVQSFLQSTTNGFTGNFSSVLNGLTASGTGVLALDAQGVSQSSQALSQQISDLQAALGTKQQNLVRVYAQVNVTLQELPLLQAQISKQLGSF
jgi:flagellar hook-associated protein 2